MRNRRSKKEKGPVRAIPLPEAIDGKEWEIQQSHQPRVAGITATGERMIVPMGDNDMERLIRVHEMTHISITPRKEAMQMIIDNAVDETIVNLVEDARVHSQMNRLGFEVSTMNGIVKEDELKQMANDSHPAILAAMACAMNGTGEEYRLQAAIDPADEDRLSIFNYGTHLSAYWVHSQPELPPFETTIEMAKEIQKYLGDPQAPPPPTPPVPPQMLPALAAPPQPDDPEVEVAEDPISKKIRPVPNAGKGPWMPLTFEEPPRPLKFPPRMRGRNKRKPAPRGRRFHRIGRLYTDGYVFADRPKTKGGGAILIDTSGSMSLTPDDVLRLCVAYPGGIIASYSASGHHGYLRIIAKNGKRVEDEMLSTPGPGNGVDGPCLDWLATQPGPRYWISDAGVEGGAAGLRYCLEVCRRFNITRVDDAWDIVGKEWDDD